MSFNQRPDYPTEAKKGLGLTFAANFLSKFAQDSVSKKSPVSSGLLVTPSPQGMGVYAPTTTTAGAVYSAGAIAAGASQFTIIVAGTFLAEAREQPMVFVGNESAPPYAQHRFSINHTSIGKIRLGTYSTSTLNEAVSISSMVDGLPHVFACRTGTNAMLSVWRDGINVTDTKTGGTGSLASSYQTYAGSTNVPSNGIGINGPISGVWIFNRMLSDAEMAQYTRNPWQLFQPAQIFNFKSIISSGNRRRRLLMAS